MASFVVVVVPKPTAPHTAWLMEWHATGPFATRELAQEASAAMPKLGAGWSLRIVPLETPAE